MELEDRGIEIQHDLGGPLAKRQCTLDQWSAHARALHRIGLIDDRELREILVHSDAAYGDIAGEIW